jgi:class 3 adenylate cyclase/tetratricopeptide (TPR) repeat protein
MTAGPPEVVVCPNCGTANAAGSRFCNSCGAALDAPIAAPVETRKTVTVLFIDATSSTALGERLDPESLRAVMTRYFDVMREVIEFHGGSVEKFIGDAVMAVFGVPVVHEDDALRACRAALEIHQRLVVMDDAIRAERGASVEWRMGINTGEVVAGDAAAGQRIVTGDPVNVAARLEGAAKPGEILLGAETRALVRADVTAEPVDPLALKGKAEAVPAWRLVAVAGTVGRRQRPLEAALVGRHRPLRLLDDAYREAVEERICHLFTVLGVAGVGKSRLVDEFVGHIEGPVQVATGRCLAYGHGITYWPVAEAIRDGAGIAESDPADVAVARLHEILIGEADADRVVGIVGNLLGLVDEVPAADEIFWGIRRTFEAMARQRPLILQFDDIHWGEATFLDLIEHIADWTRDAPVLLIVMARPELLELRPAWGGGKRSATTINLEPLSENESAELVGELLGRAELPAELRQQISLAAEGNPLFVEEVLGKLIDDGFLVESGGGWAALGDLRTLAIPPTIQALLAARLDGLGTEDRTVIERAAVEGKVFHRGAVTEMAPELMRPQVRDRLASLMRMELVRPDQAAFEGEEAYRFRHLLIRDAAYQALAKATRSELHERFAGWLTGVAGDRLAEYEEIIGYHLEQAYRYLVELGPPDVHAQEVAARAGAMLAAAARRASDRRDVRASSDLLERAAQLLPSGDPDRPMLIAEIGPDLLEAGHGARSIQLLEEARTDAVAAGDARAAAWAELGLVSVRSSTESAPAAETIAAAERLRDKLAGLGDEAGAARAELIATFALFGSGKAAESAARARALPEAVLDRYTATEARRSIGAAAVFGPVPVNEGLALLGSRGQRVGGAELGMARLNGYQGQFVAAREALERGSQRVEELGDRFLGAEALAVRAEIDWLEGDLASAVEHMVASYEGKIALGDRSFASTTAGAAAELLIEAGAFDEAMRYAEIALNTSAADDIASQGTGRAAMARVLSHRGDHTAADATAREAVAIFGATDYLLLHGNALIDLAHVLQAAERTAEAVAACREAIALYERKGASAYAAIAEHLLADLVAESGEPAPG